MKRQSILLAVTILVATIIFSCSSSKEPSTGGEINKPTFDLTLAKKQIEEINRIYMELVAKGDATGVANLYTKDARLLVAGTTTIIGRANIQSAFSRMLNAGVTKLYIETVEVFGTEDLLGEEGKVTIYVKEKAVEEEKSIILWKKEDGQWKLFRDIANSNAK